MMKSKVAADNDRGEELGVGRLRRAERRRHLPHRAGERGHRNHRPDCAKLHISSTTEDAGTFLVLRAFLSDMKEVAFQGALDPHTPIGQGRLRASHRKLDKKADLAARPYRSHDEKQPPKPGQICELDIEIIPTGIAEPKGHRAALSARGPDYAYPGGSGGRWRKNQGGKVELSKSNATPVKMSVGWISLRRDFDGVQASFVSNLRPLAIRRGGIDLRPGDDITRQTRFGRAKLRRQPSIVFPTRADPARHKP
jgi:hypothetical protein